MKPARRLLHGSTLALGVTLLATPADGPSFRPEDGAEVTKTFTTGFDFDLDDLSVVLNGQDVGAMMGALEVAMSSSMTIRVEDAYGSTSEGRLQELTRTFDELSQLVTIHVSAEGASEVPETQGSSELEGRTVVFAWDEEAGAYEAAFAGDDGDQGLLEGLEEDMDLRALLPPGEVEPGAEWEVPIEELESIVSPGGDLKILPDDAEADDMDFYSTIEDRVAEQFSDVLEGTCKCTYVGTREVDGLQVGEIRLDIEVATSADLTEAIEELFAELSSELGEEAPDVSVDAADLTLDFEGEGVLLWALDLGRAHSLDLSGHAEVAIDLAISGDVEGEAVDAEMSAEISGTVTQSLETE